MFTLGQTSNPSLKSKSIEESWCFQNKWWWSYWKLLKSPKVMKTDENINTMEINEKIKKCSNYWNSRNCFNWKFTKTNESIETLDNLLFAIHPSLQRNWKLIINFVREYNTIHTIHYLHFKRHLHLKWPVVHQQLHVEEERRGANRSCILTFWSKVNIFIQQRSSSSSSSSVF